MAARFQRHIVAFSLGALFLTATAVAQTDDTTYETRYVNGTSFTIATEGDLQVWVALFRGRNIQAIVYLVNGTDSSITFIPESIEVDAVKVKGEMTDRTRLETYSATEYERKVRRRQALAAGLYAASVSMANQPQPTTSYVSGTTTGPYGYATYSGTITTWPTAADYAAANARTQAQVSAMASQLGASYSALTSNLARPNTLTSKTWYGGVVHIKKKRAHIYEVAVPFGDSTFRYSFTYE